MLSESDALLKEMIFDPVAERVKDRRDALLNLARFPRLGIEGWLKVEATRALLDRVEKIWNNGPDLIFNSLTICSSSLRGPLTVIRFTFLRDSNTARCRLIKGLPAFFSGAGRTFPLAWTD